VKKVEGKLPRRSQGTVNSIGGGRIWTHVGRSLRSRCRPACREWWVGWWVKGATATAASRAVARSPVTSLVDSRALARYVVGRWRQLPILRLASTASSLQFLTVLFARENRN